MSQSTGSPRVLGLVTEAYGGIGGIAQYNRDFFDSLAQVSATADIHLLPRKGAFAPRDVPPRIHVHRARPARAAYVAAALGLALRLRPQVVICGHLFMVSLAAWIARLCRAKLVVQLHGIEIWRPLGARRRRALSSADLVLCVSRDTRARALAASDLPPERAAIVPNTVAEDFTPGPHGTPRRDGPLVILSVGRLDAREAYKGQDVVISCLSQLRQHGRDVIYRIAGEGDDRPRLEQHARKLGVADRVDFLGLVERNALPDLYRAADLFVLASRGEGFGIVFLEAMACGTPAIGLAFGGAVDALDGLGRAVAEDGLIAAIDAALADAAAGRTTLQERDLSDRVRARFGHDAFRSGVARAMSRVGFDQPAEDCVATSPASKYIGLPA